MEPRQKILVHAGFHKTATTTIQDYLTRNRTRLAPHLRYYGKADLPEAGTAARKFGQRPFPWRLARFRHALRGFLDTLDPGTPIVMSRETFAGAMPGHRQIHGRLVMDYTAVAVPLARVIVSELERRFGKDAEIVFLYTVRGRSDWLDSVHGHLLRSIRLTDDLAEFRARFPDLPRLEDQARTIARAIAPVRVETAALEHTSLAPEGPVRPVLDLMEVPQDVRAKLKMAPRANVGQPFDLRATFLAINREVRDKSALKARKDALVKAHWKALRDV